MTWRFMGEQDDPEMAVWLGRGLRIYDGTQAAPRQSPDAPAPTKKAAPDPNAGLYVWQNGGWVKCGCGRCFHGPCPCPA